MRRFKKIIPILILPAFLLVNVSCGKKLTDYNVDPNKMPYGKVMPESLLEELLMNTATINISRTYSFAANLVQHSVSFSSSISYDRYYVPTSSVISLWNDFYKWTSDAEHLRLISEKQENIACEAIGIIIKSYLIQTLTDTFGYVPYLEAFKSEEGNRTPAFDSQESVYRKILIDLMNVNSMLSKKLTLDNPSRDLLFGGDMNKWRKFGNSLLLRCCMRLSNRNDVIDVKSIVSDICNIPDKWPVFEKLEDAPVFYFDDVAPFINPLGDKLTFESQYHASEFMIDMMLSYSDPRISFYFKKNGSTWKGAESGVEPQDMSWSGVARLNGENLASYDSPYSLMRYDELLFLKAEAAQRGWISLDAETLYNDAITASIKYWASIAGKTVSTADINNYLTIVSYDGSLRQLMTQKYIALFGAGFEAWNEIRRTGFPHLPIGSGTLNDHILPTRLMYPVTERQNSPKAYSDVVSELSSRYKGGDNMKTPVWWSLMAINQNIK